MDHLSPEERSKLMGRVRQRDTTPERMVRSLLHAMGFRFRLHRRDLPGTPDIVLPKYRTIIFVHGCFWHRHPGCPKTTTPKANRDYWLVKFKRNVERDRKVQSDLEETGWNVLIVWECETKDNVDELAERLNQALRHDES